jgi:single-strand DNA-binding protein
MQDINSVNIVGRLTRDAELRYTNSGTAVANFAIATNVSRKNGDTWVEEGHFFDCVFFGKLAESVNQYLTKGRQVAITGRLSQNRWEDQTTGAKRSKVEIIVNQLLLLAAPQGGSTAGGNGENRATHAHTYSPQAAAVDQVMGEAASFEDDVPF